MYTVFPTGTTIYNPEKCYDGYTLFLSKTLGVGAVLVDMNGEVVRTWRADWPGVESLRPQLAR